MTRDNTQDTTNTDKTTNMSEMRVVTLNPSDAWHEVECPYCTRKSIVESTDTPTGCGTCTHCGNTVRLINDIDIQHIKLNRAESIHDVPCPCCEKTNVFNTLNPVTHLPPQEIDETTFQTTCTHCSEIIHVTIE